MEIQIKESTTVRPAEETPKHCLGLTNLDLFLGTSHVPTVYVYRRPNDCSNFFDADALKEALSKVLVPFYPVAGRFGKDENGRMEVKCNAEGVLFVAAEAGCVIDDLGDSFTPSLKLQQLVPKVDTKDISSYPLLLLQVTHFKCGGVTLGVGFHHNLGDGMSALHLINSWADMTRGIPIKNPPYVDRTVLGARVNKEAFPTFDHIEYDPPLSLKNNEAQLAHKPTTNSTNGSVASSAASVATLKLSLDQINTLKAKVRKDQEQDEYKSNNRYSTYEILAAHVWRCTCKARGLGDDQECKLYINVDGRSRLNPPLPSGYFGNVLFFTTPIALSGDIISKPLIFTAEKIHEAIKRMDDKYLRSALAYLEHKDPTTIKHGTQTYTSPGFKLNSWTRLPIYDADFGWGSPISMTRTKINYEGKAYFVPSPTNDGSASLVISLEPHQMEFFKECFYDF